MTHADKIDNILTYLLKALSGGKLEKNAAIAGTLVQIAQKSILAYQSHMGEALDPALIRPE